MSLNDTPRASRLHIGIYGRRNAGKSSLINALTGQSIALVSDEPGTTTDPVYKSMELHPVGPVVFIDTAGFDDEGELGRLRIERTEEVVDKTDIGIIVIDGSCIVENGICGADVKSGGPGAETERDAKVKEPVNCDAKVKAMLDEELHWLKLLSYKDIPVIIAINKWDLVENTENVEDEAKLISLLAGSSAASEALKAASESTPEAASEAAPTEKSGGRLSVVKVSAAKGSGLDELRSAIENAVPEDFLREKILGDMIDENGLALLVMPQDIQAPKGRLILPQVQTLRELLDRKCTAVATTADGLDRALASLNRAPDLIITDSQVFDLVYKKKPEQSALTSFSVLFAAYKGDINAFVAGASALGDMTEKSRVLIAEACTHVPLSEDIGREKIPNLLRKKFGKNIEVVNVCGNDFPSVRELSGFDLVIHCGACMFNRKHVMSRIAAAEAAGIPITNYGVVLAKLSGILDKIKLP